MSEKMSKEEKLKEEKLFLKGLEELEKRGLIEVTSQKVKFTPSECEGAKLTKKFKENFALLWKKYREAPEQRIFPPDFTTIEVMNKVILLEGKASEDELALLFTILLHMSKFDPETSYIYKRIQTF